MTVSQKEETAPLGGELGPPGGCPHPDTPVRRTVRATLPRAAAPYPYTPSRQPGHDRTSSGQSPNPPAGNALYIGYIELTDTRDARLPTAQLPALDAESRFGLPYRSPDPADAETGRTVIDS
jgi:hypothetical protein